MIDSIHVCVSLDLRILSLVHVFIMGLIMCHWRWWELSLWFHLAKAQTLNMCEKAHIWPFWQQSSEGRLAGLQLHKCSFERHSWNLIGSWTADYMGKGKRTLESEHFQTSLWGYVYTELGGCDWSWYGHTHTTFNLASMANLEDVAAWTLMWTRNIWDSDPPTACTAVAKLYF